MKPVILNLKKITQQAVSMCLILLCALLSGCASTHKVYKIGVDPTWFPLDAMNKEPYILAFSNELLQKIAHLKKCEFQRIAFSWDDLLNAVNKEQCQGILSSLEPYVFNMEQYQFSYNFLNTGPVLVMRENATSSDVDHLHDKEIAVLSAGDEQLLMQKYPDVILRNYDSLQIALVDLSIGNIDGVLIEYLQALSYVTEIYAGQLKIASAPLSKQGLKLVTSAAENKQLITLFNEGLKELQQTGEYELLLKKWKLG